MASKKRYINSKQDLEQALRIVGGVLPHTVEELGQCTKLSDKEVVATEMAKYSFEDIWGADKPLSNKGSVVIELTDLQKEINTSWGMAARGDHNVSKDVMDQMINNERKNDK